MNIVKIAQIVGTIAIFFLFCIKFYIAIDLRAFHKAGRTAILWTTFYIFFLFILRVIQLLNLMALNDLRVVSGFAAVIPLIATIFQLFLSRDMGPEITNSEKTYENEKKSA